MQLSGPPTVPCYVTESGKMKIEGSPRRRKSDVLIGTSAPMRKVLDQIAIAAGTTHPVFLLGESGTGKELVARTIHASSARGAHAFVSIHCGVIPDVLLEGELFGLPEKNPLSRFTRGPGLLAEAAGGTIFLDQIEAVPRKLQARLLGVLTGDETLPAADPGLSTPQLIAASSIVPEMSGGQSIFDQDLARSFRSFIVEMPPLRERGEDINLLAAHFLHALGREFPTQANRLSEGLKARMLEYSWPGNVRELENKVRQAVLVARKEELDVDDLFLQQPLAPEKVPSFKDAKRQFERH